MFYKILDATIGRFGETFFGDNSLFMLAWWSVLVDFVLVIGGRKPNAWDMGLILFFFGLGMHIEWHKRKLQRKGNS